MTTSPFAIERLLPALAFDSRGTPTVSCRTILAGGGTAVAIAPSGASTGTYEAVERRDGDGQYGGNGVQKALAGVRDPIGPALRGMDARDQSTIDTRLLELDGTADVSGLGGNAVLAVSLSVALAAAAQSGSEPYRWFAGDREPLLPLPMVNIFSGGAHAGSGLDVQDLLAVPLGAGTFTDAMHWVWELRHTVGEELRRRGLEAGLVADEGGFGVPLPNTAEGLAVLTTAIERVGLRPGTDFGIAIDVAANRLADGSGYRLPHEGRQLTAEQWIDEITGWCADFPVVSVEDPFAEDDWDSYVVATEKLSGVQLLGDDLFVTNTERLAAGVDRRIGSAVLVKPNQCGTITGAARVIAAARDAGYGMVVSARSGDTEESWLADLAVGWRAGQIKVGSVTRSERTAKWNRLLRLEAELGPDAEYAGAGALVTRREMSS